MNRKLGRLLRPGMGAYFFVMAAFCAATLLEGNYLLAAAEAAVEAVEAAGAEAAGAALEALEPPQATRERARAPAIAIVAIFFMIKISFSLFSQNTIISVFEKRPPAR